MSPLIAAACCRRSSRPSAPGTCSTSQENAGAVAKISLRAHPFGEPRIRPAHFREADEADEVAVDVAQAE